MNIVLIIGHRGTGKSLYLKELAAEYASHGLPVICKDLDEEIEKTLGLTVAEIFDKHGEVFFREQEEKVLHRLHQELNELNTPVFVALGAGYNRSLPEPSHVLWLQRPSDSQGRIFLNRPRILPGLKPLEESLELFRQRNYRFQQMSDETLIRPEGFERFNIWDRVFFHLEDGPIRGGITLLPSHFKQFSSWKNYILRRLKWGIDFFEIRDDLLSDSMLRLAIQEIDANKLLLSFRSKTPSLLHKVDFNSCHWDWASELGSCPFGQPTVLSLHNRGPRLEDDLDRFEQQGRGLSHLKLAIEVHSFQELERLHEWWLEEPTKRSFLPRSQTGRWSWYRLHFGRQMKISFFREDHGSAADQPIFSDWVRTQAIGSQFAAVLGDPVSHSRTPAEQNEFFTSQGLMVAPIEIKEFENFSEALRILQKFGLRAAAVTSPHKTSAFAAANLRTPEAHLCFAANTLVLKKDGQWLAHNSDLLGLKRTIESLKLEEPIAVWGGGGMQQVLELCLKNASFFSSRTGKAKDLKSGSNQFVDADFSPKTVIWCVGANRMKTGAQFPNENWKPDLVLDLNYSENSPGREYAVKVSANYEDGLTFFRNQALAQRLFWKKESS